MPSKRRYEHSLVALFSLSLLACSSEPETQNPGSFPAEYEGYYYEGDWGTILLKAQAGNRVRATYVHDEGTIEGTWLGGKLVGWWCEVPSRRATADAGDVELTFIKEGGVTRIDGRWRYGTEANEPQWREDWDVSRSGAMAPPQELLARFNDESAFCLKPTP